MDRATRSVDHMAGNSGCLLAAGPGMPEQAQELIVRNGPDRSPHRTLLVVVDHDA